MIVLCSAIPKNGGHTLIDFLKNFKLNMVLVEGSPYVHSSKYKDFKVLPNFHQNEIVLGHVPMVNLKKNSTFNTITITSIREPIERSISELAFNNGDDDLELYKYKVKNWAGDAIDNLQTRMLSDDPNFFGKISRDQLNQAIKNIKDINLCVETNNFYKLFDLFNIEKNIHLNIGDPEKKNVIQKNQELINEISKNNYYDIELYNFFCEKFNDIKIDDETLFTLRMLKK